MTNYKKYNNLIDEKIYNAENECPYYKECSDSMLPCENKLKFYRTRIGSNYDNEPIKILVVGQEDVGRNKEYECCEPCTMADAGYNPHYLKTFYTVSQILLSKDELPKDYSKDIRQEKFEELRHRFAITNYYKCAFSNNDNNSRVAHSSVMEKNCSSHLIEEIKMLKPDIVILQGKSHKTFWKSFDYSTEYCNYVNVNGKNYELGLYKTSSIKDVNKTVYIVDSYHPTSHGIWEKDEILSCFIRILNKAKEKI